MVKTGKMVTAADTDYCPAGIAPKRLSYRESRGRWHIAELRAGRKSFVSPDILAERQFSASAELLVPRQDIEYTLTAFGRGMPAN